MPINSRYILVVGGAGYIGSHMVLALRQAGYQPLVLDNLSRGHRHQVLGAELIEGDVGDKKLLANLFVNYQFSAVMHFASFIEVAESVKFPGKYYQNNVAATLNLLDSMHKYKIKNFIFSSSAAVYGEPKYLPINEKHPICPVNPYGRSKWMVEEIIKDYALNANIHYTILRYFNAAGADPLGRLGELHDPESHLIPKVLAAAQKAQQTITIYGLDYATEDGTCVRDYIHVTDLCQAHLLALEALIAGKINTLYNLGTGQGYSVAQVLKTISHVTGKHLTITHGPRRAGDPAILVADASLAKRELNWQPMYASLELIIKHAWNFIKTHV